MSFQGRKRAKDEHVLRVQGRSGMETNLMLIDGIEMVVVELASSSTLRDFGEPVRLGIFELLTIYNLLTT